ncbi:hypothetical protein JCM24511_10005 [Saitozyma sp. JCM 24511]|nr:hypothetical protein JCM24511_10005 [Saitozyma sp. JCM 24511]
MNVILLNTADDEDDEEEDPVGLDSSSLGPWDSMFNHAETARLRQDDHLGTGRRSAMVHAEAAGSGGGRKRKRKSFTLEDLPDFEDQNEVTRQLPKMRGHQSRRFEDPVDLGWCTAARGKELYDSMRSRSPFCVTTLIYVASKLEDPANTPSDLQRLYQEHAEKIGMSTLFSPISTLEVVQAMVALSSWGDTSWRPGGHAVRMAMDMGLYRCLPSLVQTGMGKGKSSEDLKEDRSLVTGARCWLTLCKMEFEMAFNLGRPALFGGEESIRLAREFLKHPLSIINDSRLVAACELLAKRLVLHQPFAFVPHALVGNDIVQTLRDSEAAAVEWYNYWDAMYLNSKILYGVRSQKDVASLSKAQLERLVVAIRAAETLIGMGLRSQEYVSRFRYANSFSHVGMGYTARFIIRMASLIPSEINLRQVAKDVEALANVLTQVPGFQFAHVLLDALKRARREKVLPPPTQPPSPSNGRHDPLEQNPQAASPAGTFDPLHGLPPFDYSLDTGGPNAMFDFSFADQLLGNLDPAAQGLTGRPSNYDTSYIDFNAASQTTLNVDDWFPFPPLDPDLTSHTFPVSSSINVDTAPALGTDGAGSDMLNGQWR